MAEDHPLWALYEAVIARLEADDDCTVLPDHHVVGRESRVTRQVDIWIEGRVGGLGHRTTIAVECKKYEPKRKLGIKDVDAFYGFLKDVGATLGVLVTTSSFTHGAEARAKGAEIETLVIPYEEALELEWDELLRERCATLSNCRGTIGWAYHEKRRESIYGLCHECGSFHIRCGFCGEYDSYAESEGYIACCNPDCRGVFTINYDNGVIVGLVARLMEEDEPEND